MLATWGTSTGRNPTLDLQFAGATSLDNRITFSRGSQATLFDSTGALVYAKQNLLVRSQEFGTSWIRFGTTTLTENTSVAPDGTTTGDNIVFTSASAGIYQLITGAALTTYTFSVWIKSSSSTQVLLVINTNLSDPTIQTLTVTSGWQRFSINKTTAAGTTSVTAQIQDNGSGNTQFDLWGAQLNIANMEGGVTSSLSTYYPTVASAYYAPRFDYNPSTLAAQGLLIEEQRTNSIRNNTMQGAVAGTPGTLPNNWAATTSASGLSRQIVGTGTEDGITYADIRYSGTATGTSNISVAFEATNQIAATPSQTWANSVYVKVSAGTLPENFFISVHEYDSSNAFLRSNDVSKTSGLTSSLKTSRQSQSITTGASTAFVRPLLYFTFTNGQVVDITLRIGLPQLEQGAFATSVIPTTTTALTRNADVASMTGTNFSSWYNASEGTLLAQVIYNADTPCKVVFINDGTYNNIFSLQREVTLDRWQTDIFSAASRQALLNFATNSASVGSVSKCASVYKVNDFAGSANGGAVITDTSGLVQASVDRLALGRDNVGSAEFLNGYIQRISYYPVRLPNSTLQALTA